MVKMNMDVIVVKAHLRGTRIMRRLKVKPDFECLQQRIRHIFSISADVKMRLSWQGKKVILASFVQIA